MFELSVVSDEISMSFGLAVKEAKQAGIARMELRMLRSGRVPECSVNEIDEVSHIAAEEGIVITAISPGLFKHCRSEADFAAELSNRLPRALELANRLNVHNVILFGFALDGRGSDDDRWLHSCLQRIDAQFRAHHLRALIEPEPICVVRTASHAKKLLTDANLTSMAINADPGNAGWVGADAAEDIEASVFRVEHLHVKDLAFDTQDCKPAWVMFGDGEIDYSRIFGRLYSSGYRGEVALEPHLTAGTWSLRDYALRVRHTMTIATEKKEKETAWQ